MLLLVFGGMEYYPSGGWEDFIGTATNIESAYELILEKHKTASIDWWHIVDAETLKIIKSG